jgi:hypothetical protein
MTDPADQIAQLLQAMEYRQEAAANARTLEKARARKARRVLVRLKALISGGWVVEFRPRQHLGLQTTTRGDRRRAQLGRS